MNSTSIAKLLTCAAAAAFLVTTPLAAQESGGQGQGQGQEAGASGPAPEPFPGPTMTDEQRRAMGEQFRTMTHEPVTEVGFDVTVGAVVPETVMLRPVPDEIITATPAVQGHQYFALPDGRIALVDANRTVVMVLD